MLRFEIKNVTKPDRYSPVERIQWLGCAAYGSDPGWKQTSAELALLITEKGYSFFVVDPLDGSEIEVVAMQRGLLSEPYVQTRADDTTRDNLLSLPEFQRGLIGTAAGLPPSEPPLDSIYGMARRGLLGALASSR